MTNKVVPTLSPAGWVKNIVDKLDFLATYIFLSNYSQSVIYADKIVSIPWLIQQYGNDLNSLMQHMTITLEEYFKRYFDEASVVVERSSKDDPASNRVSLSLIVNVIEDGQQYSLAHAVSMEKSVFLGYAKLNNGE